MKKLLLIFIILLEPVFSDDFIHIYYYPLKYDSNKIDTIKKYYNIFYEHEKSIHTKSKEQSIFILNYLPKEEEPIDNYLYILKNFYYDFINYFDQEEESLKEFKEKLYCFNCLEKNSYIYNKFKPIFLNNIKMMTLFFKNCKIIEEELKKFLYLNEDTNLWIFAFPEDNCELNILKEFYKEKNIFIILTMKENQEFYKQGKNIFFCKVYNDICYIKIKFREGELLNLHQFFIKIDQYYE
jgi:hypothetical protein